MAIRTTLRINYNPDSILFSPHHREVCKLPTTLFWDWMHIIVASGGPIESSPQSPTVAGSLSISVRGVALKHRSPCVPGPLIIGGPSGEGFRGVAQYQLNAFVLEILQTGITLQDLDGFHQELQQPRHWTRLSRTFFQDRHRLTSFTSGPVDPLHLWPLLQLITRCFAPSAPPPPPPPPSFAHTAKWSTSGCGVRPSEAIAFRVHRVVGGLLVLDAQQRTGSFTSPADTSKRSLLKF
jgi:hypothetical protein